MNCESFRDILADLLYDELDVETREQASKHAADCEACRAEQDSLRLTMSALDQWPAIEAPLDPAVAAALAKRDVARRFSLRPILTGAMAAVVAFFALTLVGAEARYDERGFSFAYGQRADSPVDQIGPGKSEDGRSEFMFLLFDPPGLFADAEPTYVRDVIGEYVDWAREMQEQGKLFGGEKLTEDAGRTLRRRDGEISVAHSPTHDEAETFSGFFHIAAESYEKAVAIARTCPHMKYGSRIEIREIEGT